MKYLPGSKAENFTLWDLTCYKLMTKIYLLMFITFVLQTTYYAEGYIESLQYSALSYSPASHFQSPTMFPSQMGEILRFTTF